MISSGSFFSMELAAGMTGSAEAGRGAVTESVDDATLSRATGVRVFGPAHRPAALHTAVLELSDSLILRTYSATLRSSCFNDR